MCAAAPPWPRQNRGGAGPRLLTETQQEGRGCPATGARIKPGWIHAVGNCGNPGRPYGHSGVGRMAHLLGTFPDQLFLGRYEDLAVDAETAVSRFDDLDEESVRRVRRLLHCLEYHVTDALYHCASLFEREHAGRNIEFYHRRPEISCWNG